MRLVFVLMNHQDAHPSVNLLYVPTKSNSCHGDDPPKTTSTNSHKKRKTNAKTPNMFQIKLTNLNYRDGTNRLVVSAQI